MQKFLDRLTGEALEATEAADAAFQQVCVMVGFLDSSQNACDVQWMAIISIYIGIADAVTRAFRVQLKTVLSNLEFIEDNTGFKSRWRHLT